ncbi:MAG: thymidine kinase [archaeon]
MKRGLELITGPMFCGKTEELLRRLRREQIAGSYVQLFKPELDNRYASDKVVTHEGISLKAISVKTIDQMLDELEEKTQVIGIDEIQFFDDSIPTFCLSLSKRIRIIASGLALDFKDEPFKFRDSEKHVGDLMPYCKITQLTSICTYQDGLKQTCGKEATHTQRLIDGNPASKDSPLILIAGKDSYEARCDEHYFI